jgi:archaeal flagellar protein FlaJ
MKKIIIIPLIIGIVVATLSILLLKDFTAIRNLILVVTLIAIIIPLVVYHTTNIKKQKEKEEKFLEFIRDIVENVKSGTPISRAIINLKGRDYGELKIHVEKLANQVSMGIPLTRAFETFADETKSPVISRSINLISEANRSGGEINTILDSVTSSVNQTENIKKERRSAIFNLIVQGYIIFCVFILIILVLEFFLMPLVESLGPISDLNVEISPRENVKSSQANFFLLLVQSFFSGLVIGKISEGKISAGIKHSFILVSLALLLFAIASLIFG